MIEAGRDSLREAGIDEQPKALLVDAGYCSEENLAGLSDDDPCYIATRNTRCNSEPRNGRQGPLPGDASLVDRMDRKVSTVAGAARYKKRKHMIEPAFGQLKDGCGARRFMRRGKTAADSEWKLLMGTHNLLKLYRRALTGSTRAAWSRPATAQPACLTTGHSRETALTP